MLLELKSGTYRIEQVISFREEWTLLAWVGKALGLALLLICLVTTLLIFSRVFLEISSPSLADWAVINRFQDFSITSGQSWMAVLSALLATLVILGVVFWIMGCEPGRAAHMLSGKGNAPAGGGVFSAMWSGLTAFVLNYVAISIAINSNGEINNAATNAIFLIGAFKVVAISYPYSRQKRFIVEDADRRHVIIAEDDYWSGFARSMLTKKSIGIDPFPVP